MPSLHTSAWDHPIVLGSRLCWFDGTNKVIPFVKIASFYTAPDRADFNEWGFIADLPTENGATVCLTYDPQNHYPDESDVSLWLHVNHPQTGARIDAAIDRLEDSRRVEYVITYNPLCLGDECPACEHGWGQWWEYVTTPDQVMQWLAWLGSLPVRAVS